MHFLIPSDGADGAHHNAGPAADAFLKVDDDVARFIVFANTARNAGQSAGRIFAMTALDRNGSDSMKRAVLIDGFHMNSRPVDTMRRRAGQLTRSAGKTFFYQTKNPLHDSRLRPESAAVPAAL